MPFFPEPRRIRVRGAIRPIGVRGGDIDKNGVLWSSGSNGSLISFDRRKCKRPLNGPKATTNGAPPSSR